MGSFILIKTAASLQLSSSKANLKLKIKPAIQKSRWAQVARGPSIQLSKIPQRSTSISPVPSFTILFNSMYAHNNLIWAIIIGRKEHRRIYIAWQVFSLAQVLACLGWTDH